MLAESDREEQWLNQHIPNRIKNIDVKAVSWRKFQKTAHSSVIKTTNHSEKKLLKQLIRYLEKVTVMQNQTSNLVYIVPLNHNNFFEDEGISFVDVIEKHQRYFHPIDKNYIAFRYDGKLQSIHHISSYKVIDDFQKPFNLAFPKPCQKHYLYELGLAIRPSREVLTNDKSKTYTDLYGSARHECYIDLLLTCNSIAEAVAKTKIRQNPTEHGSEAGTKGCSAIAMQRRPSAITYNTVFMR